MSRRTGAALPDRDGVEIVHRERSFFGSLTVQSFPDGVQMLVHGNILHGAQSLAPAERREPLTYYHREGPIGQVFEAYRERLAGAHIGVVGLGVGTLACYAEPGQSWTFFEIDGAVERLARDPRYFTYLRDCAPGARVVLGDGRLELAGIPDRAVRLLVLDAFSSDAIPVHLLTREALRLYLAKVEERGLLAFHISSRFVDLRPVLEDLAHDAGVVAAIQQEPPLTIEQGEERKVDSTWVVMARSAADLVPLLVDPRWEHLAGRPDPSVWTDDFSNVLGILRLP